MIKEKTGHEFPSEVNKQLELSIEAVFRSWMGKRAVDYRREFNITTDQANGTAVNIVAMVFGNMGETSATGVAFTRDPGTGENYLYGEYLVNAQGEDVVAGIRTPKPLRQLRKEMPAVYRQLEALRHTLENHYREIQDFEFTIENGKLYCLQTRHGKMNAWALVRTSIDLVHQGLINEEEAILRVKPEHLEQMLHPQIDPKFKGAPLATGINASPGAASRKNYPGCGQGRDPGPVGGTDPPGPGRNQTGRHSWFFCRPGDPDQPGGKDFPRGGSGPGDGQALRGRLRSPGD